MALIAVGSSEQHGPNLSMQADTAQAHAFATKLAERLYPQVLLAPPLHVGLSEHHMNFPALGSRLSWFILATASHNRCDIRLGKILAFAQQRLSHRFGKSISKAVAKIETCTMSSFSETLIGI